MPRIYVACLASYNSGTLHGAWIDAAQDESEITAEINAMLRKSPHPSVIRCDFRCSNCGVDFWRQVSTANDTAARSCPECDDAADVKAVGEPYPSAEEYAIHDDDDFEGVKISEYSSVADVVQIAKMIDKHGAPFAVYLSDVLGSDYLSDAVEKFEEAFLGEFKDDGDYAEQLTRECNEIPAYLDSYIDWEKMERDMTMSGDISVVRRDGTNYVFDNHV